MLEFWKFQNSRKFLVNIYIINLKINKIKVIKCVQCINVCVGIILFT